MFKKLDNNPFGRNEFSLEPTKESPGAWINPQSYNRYDKSKEVLCSGGANVGIVKHDGKIYRCFHDLTPIGDMLDYPNCMYKKATPCRVGAICDASGDQMSCKIYSQSPLKYSYKNNPIATRWIENGDPNNLKMEYSYWNITPTYACNLACFFCCNAYKIDYEPREVLKNERKKEDWFKFFKSLSHKTIKTSIVFIGGEPLAYYGIEDLIEKAVSYGFDCSMVTNFSIFRKLDKILSLSSLTPDNFKLSISLHPINKQFNFEKTIEYIKKFKERGYSIRTIMVSAPEQIEAYKQFKPILNSLGIDCWLKGMGGYDNHPGFTPELKKYIFDEGGYKSTAEHLDEINWIEKNWK